jgi:hypothetical protein
MADNNENKKAPTYREQAGQYYNQKYETWMPWIEDKYLSWFTNDNKASYGAKRAFSLPSPPHAQLTHLPAENLEKTKITGNEQVDNLQDGVNGLVAGQVGKGGLAQPLGDAVSKEGINRAERGGKDENGSSGPLGGYGQSAADGVTSGVKGAGGYLGGMMGGGKKEEKK